MNKEYRLQFNDKFISIEEQYQKDNGAILFGETNNDGRLYILYDSHDNKKIEFFIELIKYVADLKTKLTENIVLLEGLRKSEEEKKDIAMKRVYELKQQLAEKEQELNDICQNYDFQINDFSREVYRLQQKEKLLQQQLAEKETRISELEDKDWYEGTIKQLEEQNERLINQLAEKEKEIEDIKIDLEAKDFNINTLMKQRKRNQKFYNQAKTDFAIEQLEKVKENILSNITFGIESVGIMNSIDNQIKELKEGK